VDITILLEMKTEPPSLESCYFPSVLSFVSFTNGSTARCWALASSSVS
jgi:hypothetical protein